MISVNSTKGEYGCSFKPRCWPFLGSQDIEARMLSDGGMLSIKLVAPDRIQISLYDSTERKLDLFKSAGIRLENDSIVHPPFLKLRIKWNEGKVSVVQINDVEITRYELCKCIRVQSPTFPNHGQRSFDHPDVHNICRNAIDSRKAYFSSATTPDPQRTPKSNYQVCLELSDALTRLNKLLNFTRSGETIWLGTICTELRSLLVLDDTESGRQIKNFPPLFRVANIYGSPLPVFVSEELQFLDTRPGSFAFGSPPEIVADCDICILQDFQDWVARAFCYVDGEKPVTAKKFLKECACTMGPAHYDPDLSNIVSHLAMSSSEGIHAITGTICKIGACTLNLGAWLQNSNKFTFEIITASSQSR